MVHEKNGQRERSALRESPPLRATNGICGGERNPKKRKMGFAEAGKGGVDGEVGSYSFVEKMIASRHLV